MHQRIYLSIHLAATSDIAPFLLLTPHIPQGSPVSWKVSSIAAILSTSGSCARFALNCPSRGGSKSQPSGLHASARARQDTRTATDTHGRMNGRAPALAAHMPTCVHAKRTSLLMFTEDAIPITLTLQPRPTGGAWAVVKRSDFGAVMARPTAHVL